MRIKLPLHYLRPEVACDLNLALSRAETLGNMNKIAASPTREGGLRAQSRFSPRLRPRVMQITFHPS